MGPRKHIRRLSYAPAVSAFLRLLLLALLTRSAGAGWDFADVWPACAHYRERDPDCYVLYSAESVSRECFEAFRERAAGMEKVYGLPSNWPRLPKWFISVAELDYRSEREALIDYKSLFSELMSYYWPYTPTPTNGMDCSGTRPTLSFEAWAEYLNTTYDFAIPPNFLSYTPHRQLNGQGIGYVTPECAEGFDTLDYGWDNLRRLISSATVLVVDTAHIGKHKMKKEWWQFDLSAPESFTDAQNRWTSSSGFNHASNYLDIVTTKNECGDDVLTWASEFVPSDFGELYWVEYGHAQQETEDPCGDGEYAEGATSCGPFPPSGEWSGYGPPAGYINCGAVGSSPPYAMCSWGYQPRQTYSVYTTDPPGGSAQKRHERWTGTWIITNLWPNVPATVTFTWCAKPEFAAESVEESECRDFYRAVYTNSVCTNVDGETTIECGHYNDIAEPEEKCYDNSALFAYPLWTNKVAVESKAAGSDRVEHKETALPGTAAAPLEHEFSVASEDLVCAGEDPYECEWECMAEHRSNLGTEEAEGLVPEVSTVTNTPEKTASTSYPAFSSTWSWYILTCDQNGPSDPSYDETGSGTNLVGSTPSFSTTNSVCTKDVTNMVAGTVTVTNWGGGYLDFYPSGCGTITIHPNSGFAKRDEQHNIYFAKMAWSFYAEMAFVDYDFEYKLTEGDTDCP